METQTTASSFRRALHPLDARFAGVWRPESRGRPLDSGLRRNDGLGNWRVSFVRSVAKGLSK